MQPLSAPPTSASATDASLDSLAAHCITTRALIAETGTPTMRLLIDLLLFEIGVAIAKAHGPQGPVLEKLS